jgi:hypothetical protein
MLIVRYYQNGNFGADSTEDDGANQLELLLVGRAVGVAFDHCGQDAAEFADAEEAVAAGIAAVGGKSEPALQENEGAVFHTFAGDMLDIEIAAAGAVREALEDGSDAPGLKAVLAAVTAPGAQAGATEEEVEDSVAVRAKTIVTATLWTNHDCSERVAQNTEKGGRGQDAGTIDANGNPSPREARRWANGRTNGRTNVRIVAGNVWRNHRGWTSRRSSWIISHIHAAGAAAKEAQ